MRIEDYSKYYIQGSDHYLIHKDVFKKLFNEMLNWKEESQRLQTTANNCKRLKDNWDKLKEYIGIEWYSYDNASVEFEIVKDILNKMKDLQEVIKWN